MGWSSSAVFKNVEIHILHLDSICLIVSLDHHDLLGSSFNPSLSDYPITPECNGAPCFPNSLKLEIVMVF